MKKSLRFIAGGAVILLLGMVMTFCEKNTQTDLKDSQNLSTPTKTVGNPAPGELGKIPAATVKMLKPGQSLLKDGYGGSPSFLLPDLLTATLMDGQSITEPKTAKLGDAPPKGDILFMFDLTGSMYYALENAKTNSANIMTSIQGVITDAEFGVISHMDYLGDYNSCGYSSTYGGEYDYPYAMNQSITADATSVNTAINALNLGWGADSPESYARALYETTADASIGWRPNSKKVVVAWMDDVPHDCTLTFDPVISTGADPGRDGIAGTADDLDMDDVALAMKAAGIQLIVLHSSGYDPYLEYWQKIAGITGGSAFGINYDGSIPGGMGVAEFIAEKIKESSAMVEKVSIEVCDPAFAGWLTGVSPESYADVELPEDLPFDLTFTVPVGTPGGIYEFDVCLMGDGVVYAKQHVKIIVVWKVPLDYHPGSCPNPLNRLNKGYTPLAILGIEGFDVSQIDPASVLVEGVPIVMSYIEDVSTPFMPFFDKELAMMACNTLGPDGYMDMTIKVNTLELGTIFASYNKGDLVKIHVKGMLMDGNPFVGEDVIYIVK